MRALAGTILTPEGWIEGHVLLAQGRIELVDTGPSPVPPVAQGVVVPAFVNAHTHVGDAAARGTAIPDDLAAAVGPGGHKHRILAATPGPRLVECMRGALREAFSGGTRGLVDFREGGAPGLRLLQDAKRTSVVETRVYARPAGALEPQELRTLLAQADGIGISSLEDAGPEAAQVLAEAAHAAGKGFALHASEARRDDLGPVLDLGPELLVHLTHATRGDLEAVQAAGCKVAVCPRSNAHWVKRLPDVRAMLDLGLDVGLGSDNAMLGPCDVRAEARALLQLAPGVQPLEALRMLCFGGWGALHPGWAGPLEPGRPADLLVFPRRAGAPEAAVLAADAAPLHRERGAPGQPR